MVASEFKGTWWKVIEQRGYISLNKWYIYMKASELKGTWCKVDFLRGLAPIAYSLTYIFVDYPLVRQPSCPTSIVQTIGKIGLLWHIYFLIQFLFSV